MPESPSEEFDRPAGCSNQSTTAHSENATSQSDEPSHAFLSDQMDFEIQETPMSKQIRLNNEARNQGPQVTSISTRMPSASVDLGSFDDTGFSVVPMFPSDHDGGQPAAGPPHLRAIWAPPPETIQGQSSREHSEQEQESTVVYAPLQKGPAIVSEQRASSNIPLLGIEQLRHASLPKNAPTVTVHENSDAALEHEELVLTDAGFQLHESATRQDTEVNMVAHTSEHEAASVIEVHRSRHAAHSVGVPWTPHSARGSQIVKASKRASGRRPAQNGDSTRHTSVRDPQAPSEEDLLFFLMSRARENKDVRQRMAFLEQENRHLRKIQNASQIELQQAKCGETESIRRSNRLRQHLEDFKKKYYKLKQWALETNKDCEELQEKAARFRESVSAATEDKAELVAQVEAAKSATAEAVAQMVQIRGKIQGLKDEHRTQHVEQLQQLAAQNENKAAELDQLCGKLDAHISHSETTSVQSETLAKGQEEVKQALQDMTEKLGALRDCSKETRLDRMHVSDSLGRIQKILENDLSTTSDIQSLERRMDATNTSVDKLGISISSALSEAITNFKQGTQNDVASYAQQLLYAAQAQNGQLIGVGEILSQLQTKADEGEKTLKALQELMEPTQEISPSLAQIKISLQEAFEAQKNLTEREIKDIIAQLSDAKSRSTIAEADLQQVRRQLEEKQDELNKSVRECRTEREERTQKLAGLQTENDALRVHLGEASQERDHARSQLRRAEDTYQEKCNRLEREHNELVSFHELSPRYDADLIRWNFMIVNLERWTTGSNPRLSNASWLEKTLRTCSSARC
jgi:hypothetical protein